MIILGKYTVLFALDSSMCFGTVSGWTAGVDAPELIVET